MATAKLSIDLVAKLANIERDFAKVSGLAEKSAKQMEVAFSGASGVIQGAFAGLAGAFSVGAFIGMVKSSIDAADSLSKLSQRTGETVENLSALQYAGSLADVSNEALATGLKQLSKHMAEAAGGSGEAADAFNAMGISVIDGSGKLRSSGDVLRDIADRFASYKDSAAKTALSLAVLGRAGSDLITLLNGGSKGFDDAGAEAKQFGAIISGETAQAAADFNDQMTRINTALGGFAKQTAADSLPVLTALADSLVNVAKEGDSSRRLFPELAEVLRTFIIIGGNVAYVFKSVGNEIGGMAAQIAALSHLDFKGFANIGEAMREDADANRKTFDRWQQSIIDAGKTFNAAKPIVPAAGGNLDAPNLKDPKARKVSAGRATKAIDDGQRLVEQLRDRIRGTQDLTEVEKLELAIADGKYKTATAANIAIARGYAETLDAIKASKVAAEEEADAQRKRLEIFAEGQRVFESVRTPMEALDVEISHLVELLDYGAITMDTFGRAASQAGEGFIKMADKAKQTNDVLDEFAKSAARNIQSAFADFLFDPFADGMNGMLKSFGNTVKRMVAEAVAADITGRLFGDLSKGGVGDGLLGGALKYFTSNADGNVYNSPSLSQFSGQMVTSPRLFAFANGAGLMGEAGPEAILPLSRGSDGKLGVQGGGSHTFTFHLHGVTNESDGRRASGQVGRQVLRALGSAERYR